MSTEWINQTMTDMKWVEGPNPFFYLPNSDRCHVIQGVEDKTIAANVVWGIVHLILGAGIILFNFLSLVGLYKTTTKDQDIFRPVIYTNISILNLLNGMACLFSGGIILSNFDWNDDNDQGTFLCQLFGIIFSLSLHTKLVMISISLTVTILCVVLRVPLKGMLLVNVSTVIVLLAWAVGLTQAMLPLGFGSQYTQPDYLSICTADFTMMDKVDRFYHTQLVLMFAPLLMGILIIFFTVPGLTMPGSHKVYCWMDEELGTFTMTTLFISYVLCHTAYFIVHIAGLWILDGGDLLELCNLTLTEMRYFFSFGVFACYISALAEPLSYLIPLINTREVLFDCLKCGSSTRIQPVLIDIRHQAVPSSAGSVRGLHVPIVPSTIGELHRADTLMEAQFVASQERQVIARNERQARSEV